MTLKVLFLEDIEWLTIVKHHFFSTNMSFREFISIYGKNYLTQTYINMNINELFETIQDEFLPEEINGEYTLLGSLIVWSYDLNDDSDDLTVDDEDDEYCFDFETQSSEELLLEAHQEDLVKLNEFLDELEETDNWTISETETNENVITFKIY